MQLKPDDVKNTLLSCVSEMAETPWLFSYSTKDFSRNRKISFSDVILSTISLQKSSTKHELLQYFDFSTSTPTLSAFIQQRKKIRSDSFKYLFYDFMSHFDFNKTYNGYKLLAVDGSDIYIPRNPKDTSTYRITDIYNKGYNQMHLTALYDLNERIYLDFVTQNADSTNEYNAFCSIIDSYCSHKTQEENKGTIFIADRGFHSMNVIAHLIENGTYFVIRAKDTGAKSFLNNISELPCTPEYDFTYKRWLTRNRTKNILSEPDIYKSIGSTTFDYIPLKSSKLYYIEYRIVKILLPNGNSEVLVTNLPDYEFGIEELKALYHLRWGIETSFRELKLTLGLLYFHGKSKEFILQEIYAKMILYNFCEIITGLIAIQKIREQKKNCKYVYQINYTMAMYICVQFLQRGSSAPPMDVVSLISNYLLPIRLNRCSPRYIKSRTAATFLYR